MKFNEHYKEPRGNTRLFLMVFMYLFTDLNPVSINTIGLNSAPTVLNLARSVFGDDTIDKHIKTIFDVLSDLGYSTNNVYMNCWRGSLCYALLKSRSSRLEDLTLDILEEVRKEFIQRLARKGCVALSQALANLNIIPHPLTRYILVNTRLKEVVEDKISKEWLEWCDKWKETSVTGKSTTQNNYNRLKKIGRWLFDKHPEIISPAQWTRELTAEFTAFVDNLKIGDYVGGNALLSKTQLGKPIASNHKVSHLTALRVFIRDCQHWGWIERKFDPIRGIPIPPKFLLGKKAYPRIIQDDLWAKLLWAGLNLTEEDLPQCKYPNLDKVVVKENPAWYPLTMVKAVAITWLFSGLRSDEIRRLRVGCIREIYEKSKDHDTNSTVCLIDVPINKTGSAFTKPVDYYIKEVIEIWEKERPVQPKQLDEKTNTIEDFLFMYKAVVMGSGYINKSLIPILCRKANVPLKDARGKITSHRARSTIATQLLNANEPMTLFELQKWLGHRSVASTQYYAEITQAKLSKSFRDAGYFERNRRTIGVLLDRDAIVNGNAALGENWKYYDLGHGYCSYDFFHQCPHRMACAKCSFYIPKESSQAQLLESKSNLERMIQEIPLREEERAAIEDGVEAVQHLLESLKNIPTPDGKTTNKTRSLPVLSKFNEPS